MAKKIHAEYIDVDRTVLLPSPQRVRNILTLEERVRAILAYECRPMYTKVAKMFNCSWEQIKNIIANRDAIMDFYEATKNTERHTDANQDEMRQQKISFLGECIYEYIQRAQFHTKADVTEQLLRSKAFEFRDFIQISNFTPNKAWINHFKATYNFSLANRQIMLTRTPPASLDLKDIVTYCTKYKHNRTAPAVSNVPSELRNLYRTTTQIAISSENNATLEEFTQRRQRKIDFLEKALYEYIQRSQYHHMTPLNEEWLRKIACDLRDTLKIDNFIPNKAWFNHLKNRFDFTFSQCTIPTTRTPLVSLDLKDILSYCSRQENTKLITLSPKEPKLTTVSKPPTTAITNASKTKRPSSSSTRLSHNTRTSTGALKPQQEIKEEVIDLDDDEEVDIKPDMADLVQKSASKGSDNSDHQPPPLKIQKIESMCDSEQRVHSPGHWSEHSDKEEEEDLPKHVSNYKDALKLLKPLEEFAMLEENYRVIGLISQLEEIFKNPPQKGE